MAKPTEVLDFVGAVDNIQRAIGDLSLEEVCELHNQLREHEFAMLTKEREIAIYDMHDIETWQKSVSLEITQSDDNPDDPYDYWLDGEPSDVSFPTEKSALLAAFEAHHEK